MKVKFKFVMYLSLECIEFSKNSLTTNKKEPTYTQKSVGSFDMAILYMLPKRCHFDPL
jgi:hypothetical protein